MKNLRIAVAALLCLSLMTWLIAVRPAGSFIGAQADDTTPTPAAAPTYIDGISKVTILYESEEVEVLASSQVYYAPLKKDTDKSVKATELVEAAKIADGRYLVDISTLSASKVNYLGLCVNKTPGTDGTVKVYNLTVAANQKKIVFNVNWGVEGPTGSGYKILKSVIVSNNNGTTDTYTNIDTATSSQKPISSLNIQWRKGANCAWNSITTLTESKWTSMKNSGAVIYFRIAAKNQTDSDPGCRYSKENKIKLAITKGPAVKVDISKLNVAIKNGMQFRPVTASGAAASNWSTILAYSAKGTQKDAVRAASLASVWYDPETEVTTTKVATLPLDRIYEISGVTPPTSGASVTFEVRIAATPKKPASRPCLLTLQAQGSAPSANISADSSQYKITDLRATDGLVTSPKFEFCIVKKAHATATSGSGLDLSSIRWSVINNNSTLKTSLKTVYKYDGATVTASLAQADSILLIRRSGVSATAKTPTAVLASKYLVLNLPGLAASPTPSASPSPSPTATATPVPSP